MLPETQVLLLVGVKPKDTVQPKSRSRKDLLLMANKKHLGSFPKQSLRTAKFQKF